jgi:hypothetical protein
VPADPCWPKPLNMDIRGGRIGKDSCRCPTPNTIFRGSFFEASLSSPAQRLFPDHQLQVKPMSIRALRPGYH